MTQHGAPQRDAADALALERILVVRPQLTRLARAGDQLGLRPLELLHAGPPLPDPRRPCTPILNAAVAAALLENWAHSESQARDMVLQGDIVLQPAQDRACVLPLADVLSPSMWVQVVQDAQVSDNWCCSPLNGGMTHPLRVGIFDADVVSHLRWLSDTFAPALAKALTEPVALIELADQGLRAGDDGHGKTAAMTDALADLLKPRLDRDSASTCLGYLAQSPGFFLNLWMAACRCMLAAAAGTHGAGIVTAAGGNGQTFGIQVAGLPNRWLSLPATAPVIPQGTPEQAAASLGAIGDSALVDLMGFGAMTTLAIPREPAAFVTLWPDQADAPAALLGDAHPAFANTHPRVTVNTRRAAAGRHQPLVSLGVLDKAGQAGRVGGGFYRVPSALFERAETALTHAH